MCCVYNVSILLLLAKSIARYEMISKCRKSAEYYLLGTLLSALFAISIAIILR